MRAVLARAILGLPLYLLLVSLTWAEDSRWGELIQAGDAALEAKQFKQAEDYYKQALLEATSGSPQDSRLIDSLRRLSQLYVIQGRTLEREPLALRLLEFEEERYGRSDLQLVPQLLDVGFIYLQLQRSSDADPFVRRALEIREAALGPLHDQTLELVVMLGHVCLGQRKFREAEELFRRSLQAHQGMEPPNREAIARDLRNLASVNFNQGLEAEAEALLRQAKEYSDEAGSGGIDRILGNSYWAQKRYAEAEPLLLNWLRTEEASMGPNHPNTLVALGEIESFYRAQGKNSEADAYGQRAAVLASKLQKESPASDPEQADWEEHTRLTNAASTIMGQGDFSGAEKLYLQALSALKRSGQIQGLTMAGTIMSVANARCFQGKYEAAAPLFKQSVEMAENALGRNVSQTVELRRTWGHCLMRLGRYAEADDFYRQWLAGLDPSREVQPGVLLSVVGDYIRLLLKTHRDAEANPWIERAARIRAQLREENPDPE
jgi:tetratricopeptide (TPR) repeat protein